MLLPWIFCGLIIFASTISLVLKKTGSPLIFNEEMLLSMFLFAIMGPISIFLGSLILNDFHNK